MNKKYDVTISFAGEDRYFAKELADCFVTNGIKTFYDEYEKANLWGRNLYTYLSNLYQKQAKYCILIVSKNYPIKKWTKVELEAAQVRKLEQDQDYILPIRLDNTEVNGLMSTIGYLSCPPETPETITNFLLSKLGKKAIQTIPFLKSDISNPVIQLPQTIKVGILGPSGSGKSMFVLTLINFLMHNNNYEIVPSEPDKFNEQISSMFNSVRLSKLPESITLHDRLQNIMMVKNRQDGKYSQFEIINFNRGEILKPIEPSNENINLKTCNCILLLIPCVEITINIPIVNNILYFLKSLGINKPLGVVFTKWDLLKKNTIDINIINDDKNILNKIINNEFIEIRKYIEHEFKNHSYFYFSSIGDFNNSPSTFYSPLGIENIINWIANISYLARTNRLTKWLEKIVLFIKSFYKGQGMRERS